MFKTTVIYYFCCAALAVVFLLAEGLITLKSVKTRKKKAQQGITTVYLPLLFAGVFSFAGIFWLFLLSISKAAPKSFVFIGFVALSLLNMLFALCVSVWKIEFNPTQDFFMYRSSFAKTHRIYYKDCVCFRESDNALIIKTQCKTFVADIFAVGLNIFVRELRRHNVPKQKSESTVKYKTSHRVVFLITGIGWVALAVFVCTQVGKGEEWMAAIFIAATVAVLCGVVRAFRWKIEVKKGLSFFEYTGAFSKTRTVYYKDCSAKRFLRDYLLIKENRRFIVVNRSAENIELLYKELKANNIKV